MLSYAAITPARNEQDGLFRLGIHLRRQTLLPKAWVIVDDGSTDRTLAIARLLQDELRWIHIIHLPANGAELANGRLEVREKIAFEYGVSLLRGSPPDVVVKVDADISMPPDHFERLMREFGAEPRLGIASGSLYERR